MNDHDTQRTEPEAIPLRVLIVSPLGEDHSSIFNALRVGGYTAETEIVDTPHALGEALVQTPRDLILIDTSSGNADPLAMVASVRDRGLDVPVIVISGTPGEDTAVDVMKAGANDFLVKEKLARLVPAVRRELRDAAVRAERKAMQDHLLLSDRMASVGVLAAGVAHEINNPLAAVIANLDFVARELASLTQNPPWQRSVPNAEALSTALRARIVDAIDALRDAREAADRVRHIVRDLKTFSRPEQERGPVDVRRVIESSIRMAWNEIRHRARLTRDYHDVPPTEANEARIGQVFLNLLVNAAQSIPEGNVDHNEIHISTRYESGRVVVVIKDTGSGITKEHFERIFDPFFTTKPIGSGTGLGLSICHRIVCSLGGDITCESALDKGSVFRVSLPAALPQPFTSKPEPIQPKASPRARILVIDDEAMICAALARTLSVDHEVVTVTNGSAALARVVAGEQFDLIFCDLMMPNVSGMDVFDTMNKTHPEQARRVVFLTGGAFTQRAKDFMARVRNHRIDKPFDTEHLRALIPELLRRNHTSVTGP